MKADVSIKKIANSTFVHALCIVLVAILFLVNKRVNKKNTIYDNTNCEIYGYSLFLNEGNEIRQGIRFEKNIKKMSLQLCFGTYDSVFSGDDYVKVRIENVNGDVIAEQKMKAGYLSNQNMSKSFVFEDIDLKKGEMYYFVVSTNFTSSDTPLVMLECERKQDDSAEVTFGGTKADYNYRMIIGE